MKTLSFSKFMLLGTIVAGMLIGCAPKNEVETPDEQAPETINSKVIMRSCGVNGNQWEILPEYPTEAEITKVMALIGENKAEEASFPEGCTEYIIQHLAGAHHMYSYQDWNGAWHNNIDGTASQEFFQVKELSGNWQHVYNFNAGKCDNAATHNAALMDGGFLEARTLNEYASNLIPAWRIFLIDGQYYLGIDFSAKKGDGEIPADGIYDDWVVKIIPLNGTPAPKEEEGEEGEEGEGDDDPTVIKGAHVEFDIHQQQHKDWKEIKTSIHIRDTVDFTVLLPIPEAYQAESDDFDIRLGDKYEYLAQSIQVVDQTYDLVFTVTHKAEGIEIFVKGSDFAPALRAARALYGDGLTFEVHTYVKNELNGTPVTDEQVWNWLKQTKMPTVSPETHLLGQITSAFFTEDGIKMDNAE